MNYLLVFIGSGIGGLLRHGVSRTVLWFSAHISFPLGTLTVNIMGSFFMGLIAEYFALRSGLSMHWRLFLLPGILGGFTTFSAFSLETILLFERGQIFNAALYVMISVIFSLGAMLLAMSIMRNMNTIM